MYAWLWGRETVLPGCVWSRPRPEELKALNVIIRVVGEPSSNHTQITYTLTPTYNTSHSRVVCVCVSKKKKADWDWERERKTKYKKYMQHVCILCYCEKCVLRQACGEWMKVRDACAGEAGVFFSTLSSSLSSCQSFIPPLYFPFLHAAPDVKAVKYKIIEIGLLLHFGYIKKQLSLCSFLTCHTHTFTLLDNNIWNMCDYSTAILCPGPLSFVWKQSYHYVFKFSFDVAQNQRRAAIIARILEMKKYIEMQSL